jgi:nicotinamide-nucleotide amidase
MSVLRTAEVIAVGSELLGWTRLDTNSLFIADQLSRLGIELKAKTVVGDDRARIEEIFRRALDRVDLVVITGGLGPTDDDLTREAVAGALGLELVVDEAIATKIRERFERRGLAMPAVNRKQAMVPRGATSIPNANGSAPGIRLHVDRRLVVLLPGPPRELQPMMLALCAPGGAIASAAGPERLHRVSVFSTGLPESQVEAMVQPIYSTWRDQPEPIETTILASPGQVELHLTLRSPNEAAARARLAEARAALTAALGDAAYSTDGRRLPELVGDLLRERRLTIAAAESCTGGMLLERLTSVAGSSAYVAGGVVAYSNELKTRLLDVDPALIESHGAVSEPVAAAMVDGVRARTGADVGVAITGIAGPQGGTPAKPVGTVVIALGAAAGPLSVHTHLFVGDREMVRMQATLKALDRVRLALTS